MAHAPLPGALEGRCCGRQPLRYKHPPHLFCPRCDRAYSVETGKQLSNWAWKLQPDGSFLPTYPDHEYAKRAAAE